MYGEANDINTWLGEVHDWASRLPVAVQEDPGRVACTYLLRCPALESLVTGDVFDIATGFVDWDALTSRASCHGPDTVLLVMAAWSLAQHNSDLALHAVRYRPTSSSLHWARRAAAVYEYVAQLAIPRSFLQAVGA